MTKKHYVAPCAEHILFAPVETVANNSWTWNWGTWKLEGDKVASVAGTNTIWSDAMNADQSDDPY